MVLMCSKKNCTCYSTLLKAKSFSQQSDNSFDYRTVILMISNILKFIISYVKINYENIYFVSYAYIFSRFHYYNSHGVYTSSVHTLNYVPTGELSKIPLPPCKYLKRNNDFFKQFFIVKVKIFEKLLH